MYDLYILECGDRSFDVGSTSDLDARIRKHQAGPGPQRIPERLPVRFVFSEPHPTLEVTVQRQPTTRIVQKSLLSRCCCQNLPSRN
jgi:predicted GIY-YIG superfamily endonuclease